MRLNIKDQREISAIQASFTDADYEAINAEVERRVSLKKTNPIHSAIEDYERDEFTQQAADYLFLEDCEYQEEIEKMHWDLQEKLVSRERAITLWRNSNSYSEVA